MLEKDQGIHYWPRARVQIQLGPVTEGPVMMEGDVVQDVPAGCGTKPVSNIIQEEGDVASRGLVG